MTDRELMQQALDALEGAIDAHQNEINDHITKYGEWYRPQRVEFMRKELANTEQTIEALRARLAQPEPEPVACPKEPANIEELYTAPPQREWQGLTDEEKQEIYRQADAENWDDQPLLEAVEAKLKEKNNG